MEGKDDQPRKCFCSRCFGPIDPEDKVEINGQCFHKNCCTCCVCNQIPKSLKMFYGHVFCEECFKTHVLARLRGEMPRVYTNNWWVQFAPGAHNNAPKAKDTTADEDEKKTSEDDKKDPESDTETDKPSEMPKKCFCARCLQAIDNKDKININGQSFHRQCCKCCCCNCTPKVPKIYFGQVFCENCFYRFVMSKNKDNPNEFFKTCLEEWQSNSAFAENIKKFMASNENKIAPVVFMTGHRPPFSRCGTNAMFGPNEPHELRQTEPKKSATRGGALIKNIETRSLSQSKHKKIKRKSLRSETADVSEQNTDIFEQLADFSISTKFTEQFEDSWKQKESAKNKLIVPAAEKIENLTKYLHKIDIVKNTQNFTKKWQNVEEAFSLDDDRLQGWVSLQHPKLESFKGDCPLCLWHCGVIYVKGQS